MRVYDSEGNEFTVSGGHGSTITLRGQGGEKEIAASDMKFYKPLPPAIYENYNKLHAALKSGAVTIEDFKKNPKVMHGVYEDLPDRPLLCNRNRSSKGSGLAYTRLPDVPMFRVTCKNCLRVARKGIQTTLPL